MRVPKGRGPRTALAALGFFLGACGPGEAQGQDTRARPSESAQAPALERESEAATGERRQAGWAFGVRDNPQAEPVWIGAWTAEGCERLLVGFVARSRFPSRQMSGCRPVAFTSEANGRQVWAMTFDGGFVVSAAEATCNQTVARIMPNQEHQACAHSRITPP
jgi:hypothetical protein